MSRAASIFIVEFQFHAHEIPHVRAGCSADRLVQLRLFAIAFPALFWATYLAVAVIGFGSGWTVPELTGIPVQAGIVGFIVSYVFVGDGR